MAHRIYLYNINPDTGDNFPHYLGEWNYEIPPLLLPLLSANIRSKGKQLYANKEQGISNLRRFYDLLGEAYQLTYKKAFYEPVNTMFDFLHNLPYDTFQIDATDVFNMREEKHADQAKDWVIQIKENALLFEKAIEQISLEPLQEYLNTFGYQTFLEALQTDWINYGLGYWNDDAYKNDYVEIYTENNLEGLIDGKGNIILPASYDDIGYFVENIAVVKKADKFGYIDAKGRLLVPLQYDDALDAFKIYNLTEDSDEEYKILGIVVQDNLYGLLDIYKNTITIPTEYSELEQLSYNYFNAKKDNEYVIIDQHNQLIIDTGSETPYEAEGYQLLFSKILGSSKRRYYSREGVLLGEFVEDVVENISHNHFYVRPNKWQKKIEIIKPDGSVLESSIDQIITLDIYDIIAYKKNKEWFLYNLKSQKLCEIEAKIQAVIIAYFSSHFHNTFILKTDKGLGLYDALQNNWLIPLDTHYEEIHYLYEYYFYVKTTQGYRYWNGQTKQSSELYDYISEPIHIESQKLLLYKNDQLFVLTSADNVIEIPNEEIGNLYQSRHNLRGKDGQYFNSYYEKWKANLGNNYYHFFDNESLYELASDLTKYDKIDEAIPLLQLGAKRQHPRMMTELAIIYADENNGDFYDIQEAFELYQKAAKMEDSWALNNLGTFYQSGKAGEQNIEKTIALYTKAGELGNGLGWENLGDLYYFGELVEQDYEKAEQYYLKAKKLFHFNEDKLTEIYYSRGEFNKVIPLLKKDRDENFSPIYYGILYENGYGLKINIKKAILYYEKALLIGNYPHAIQRLLYHYQKVSPFANEDRFKELLELAHENEVEIFYEEIGLEKPKKDSFFKKLFKK